MSRNFLIDSHPRLSAIMGLSVLVGCTSNAGELGS